MTTTMPARMMVAVIMVVSFSLVVRFVGVTGSLVDARERQAQAVEEPGCPERAVLALELGLVFGAAEPGRSGVVVSAQGVPGRGLGARGRELCEKGGGIEIDDHGWRELSS